MLTFTAPHGIDHVPHSKPSPAYLAMLGAGLRESRGWDQAAVDAYFARLIGSTVPE